LVPGNGCQWKQSNTAIGHSRRLDYLEKKKNDRVFQRKEKSVDKVISEIQDEARLWTRAGAKHLCPFVVDVDRE